MMPLKTRSMTKVVPRAKRASDRGAKIMVPYEVITSPAMWMPMPIAHTAK